MHKAADHPANIPLCANTSQPCEEKQVYLSDWAFIGHIPDDGSLGAQGNSLSDAYIQRHFSFLGLNLNFVIFFLPNSTFWSLSLNMRIPGNFTVFHFSTRIWLTCLHVCVQQIYLSSDFWAQSTIQVLAQKLRVLSIIQVLSTIGVMSIIQVLSIIRVLPKFYLSHRYPLLTSLSRWPSGIRACRRNTPIDVKLIKWWYWKQRTNEIIEVGKGRGCLYAW